jgi:hypothetical protein
MEYIQIRPDLKSGDVVAITSGSLVSRIVRLFTLSSYSHVGIILDIHGRKLLLEAVPPVVRIIPLSNKSNYYVIKLDKVLSPEAENLAFSYIGTAQYSVLEAIKSYFGLNRNPEAWQCVELVKRILQENGTPTDCKDTPRALVEYLLNTGGTLIHID